MNELSTAEIARYQRHLSLQGFGPEGQARLKASSVLVIGAGGLGCPALLYLAAAGVGRIVVIDDDRVDSSNLQRQVLYTEGDVGALKAEAAARRLRARNLLVGVEVLPVRLTRANALEVIRGCDVVIDGSDNFATRYLVNDACVLANRPFVYGAVQGFEGHVSVFNWRGGPTYRCLFPEPPAPGSVPNCSEAGVLGVVPGLVGTAQACEAIKLLAGIGEPLSGRLMIWNALDMSVTTLALRADPSARAITELPPEGYGETCGVPATAAGSPESAAFPASSPVEVPEEIDASALRAELASGPGIQILDVREGWERRMGSIEPSEHVPLGRIEGGDIGGAGEFDRARPVVVYCAHGVRSFRAMQLLRGHHGFPFATSLRGGFAAWRKG